MQAEKFETAPILFGDFMKMGADPSDRIYEEVADISKVKNLLADVSWPISFFDVLGNL